MHNYKITFSSRDVYKITFSSRDVFHDFHEGFLTVNIQAESDEMALSKFTDTYGNLEPHNVSITRYISDEELMSI